MKAKLTHNLGLKVASLLLACILWFLVAQIGNPRDTKTYSNIPVRLINAELLDGENKYFEVLDNTDIVRVTISAPRSITQNLRASDIVAEADVSKLTDINTIAISYTVLNADIDSISGDHDTVRLSVEEKADKWIRLKHAITGEVADNYIVANAAPDQTMIEVAGPKSLVDQISYAYVEMDVTGATTNMSANVEFDLLDTDGNKVDQSKLKMNVNQVHMSAEVLATKEVPIEYSVVGEAKEGYLATGEVECNPTYIRIAGSSYALANVTQIQIPSEYLDITDAERDVKATVMLKNFLPENIRLADQTSSGKINLTIFVAPVVYRTMDIPLQNVTIRNIPDGYAATIEGEEDEAYHLDVEGLEEQVSTLRDNGIYGYVDINAWVNEMNIQEIKTGVYDIPVAFSLNEGIKAGNEPVAHVSLVKQSVE